MKIAFVVVALVLALKDTCTGMPMLGGARALPPAYVRSAEFANESGGSITLEVSFETNEPKTYHIENGRSETVEGEIDHGSWTAVDPITSFKVLAANGELKTVPVSSTGGVLRLRYNIGVGAANGLEITKTVVN